MPNLSVNGMHNGVSASTGLSGKERARDDHIRRLCIRIGSEAVRVGQACGYRLEKIAGHDPETLARAGEGDARALDEVETRILNEANSNTRSDMQRPSMGQDMLKGRRTEIDFINGVIVERGAEIGRPAPINAKLVAAVKRVERGEIPARPENLYSI